VRENIILIVIIIAVILVINLFIAFNRPRKTRTRRKGGRNYLPPDEAKQAQWRDKEIVRINEREQDGAIERVKLRNETLELYDIVRQRHAKKDALRRVGIDIGDDGDVIDSIENLTSAKLGQHLKDGSE